MKRLVSSGTDPWLLLAFLLPFTMYLSTLAPSVTFYDSGEFITAIHVLGSAHSPGYPLFLLFAKPFIWLPFGSIAFRVNLATAFSAALACVGVYLLVRRLLDNQSCVDDPGLSELVCKGAALAGALLFATSPRLWLQSNHDKPYPLLAFLVALAFLCLLHWREELLAGNERPAWWYLVGFLAGLASGAHQTIILLVPGWLLFVLVTRSRMLLRARELLLTAAFALAGGAVQLYLPLRAAAASGQNWGDPSSLSRFLWHILRHGYPEEPHGRGLGLLLEQLGGFSILHEFGWIGLVLVLAGLVDCWRRQRPFVVACVTALLCFWGLIVGVFNPQPESIFLTEEFYTPLYLLTAALIAVGLHAVLSWGLAAAERSQRYGWQHQALVLPLLFVVPVFLLAAHYRANDQHSNYIAQDYAVNTLRSLPEQAVLFTWGDSGAFPLWYLQSVERLREDVDLPHIPHLVFGWYQRELPRLQAAFEVLPDKGMTAEQVFGHLSERLMPERPILVDYSTRHSLTWGNREPMPFGMVFRLSARRAERLAGEATIWDLLALHRLGVEQVWQIDQDSHKAVLIMAHSLLQAAEQAARAGQREQAGGMLAAVYRMVPSWRDNIEHLQRRYDLPMQGRGELQ